MGSVCLRPKERNGLIEARQNHACVPFAPSSCTVLVFGPREWWKQALYIFSPFFSLIFQISRRPSFSTKKPRIKNKKKSPFGFDIWDLIWTKMVEKCWCSSAWLFSLPLMDSPASLVNVKNRKINKKKVIMVLNNLSDIRFVCSCGWR